MDENAGQSPDESEKSENKAASSAAGESPSGTGASESESKLPVVWSPKLDAGEGAADDGAGAAEGAAASSADTANEQNTTAETAAGAASEPTLSRSLRFAMLAASLAAAAALGSFVGALSASGVAYFWPHKGSIPATVAAAGNTPSKSETAEFAALRSNLDSAARSANSQFAKLAERLDRLERAQTEPAAKLAHIAETVDRIEREKKNLLASTAPATTAPETTGTIPNSAPAPADAKPPEKILQNWVVQDVRGGRALIENRYGGLFDVGSGSVLPGLGRVEAIKRQDGHWTVVTARGVISSTP